MEAGCATMIERPGSRKSITWRQSVASSLEVHFFCEVHARKAEESPLLSCLRHETRSCGKWHKKDKNQGYSFQVCGRCDRWILSSHHRCQIGRLAIMSAHTAGMLMWTDMLSQLPAQQTSLGNLIGSLATRSIYPPTPSMMYGRNTPRRTPTKRQVRSSPPVLSLSNLPAQRLCLKLRVEMLG